MTMRVFAISAFWAAMNTSAGAQLSVTTIGATDAAQCFRNAMSTFTNDEDPCDKALRDGGTRRADKMRTYVNRGIIRNRVSDLSGAIDDFNAALAIDAELAEAFLNRGNSYFLGQSLDAALSDYQRSLDLKISEPWSAWYNIGLVYEAKKDHDAAQEAFLMSLAAKPDFVLAQNKLKQQ